MNALDITMKEKPSARTCGVCGKRTGGITSYRVQLRDGSISRLWSHLACLNRFREREEKARLANRLLDAFKD